MKKFVLIFSIMCGVAMASIGTKSFVKTVTTAGTRVALSTAAAGQLVIVKAKRTNSGYIYIGGSDVSSSVGMELAAGAAVSFSNPTAGNAGQDIDLRNIYIDASVNGDGVEVIYSAQYDN